MQLTGQQLLRSKREAFLPGLQLRRRHCSLLRADRPCASSCSSCGKSQVFIRARFYPNGTATGRIHLSWWDIYLAFWIAFLQKHTVWEMAWWAQVPKIPCWVNSSDCKRRQSVGRPERWGMATPWVCRAVVGAFPSEAADILFLCLRRESSLEVVLLPKFWACSYPFFTPAWLTTH